MSVSMEILAKDQTNKVILRDNKLEASVRMIAYSLFAQAL
jgi:hypothetical protein